MTYLVLSPHFDDAVWSCGGILAAWRAGGRDVIVLTVFDAEADQPPAFPGWTPMVVRAAENDAVLARLGVRDERLGWPEALLRRAADGVPRYGGVLALRRAPHGDDNALVAPLAEALRPWVCDHPTVFAPVGTGAHVDHVLVRRAAELVVPAGRLRYYAEFPYSPDTTGLTAREYTVDFHTWLRSAGGYRSQVEAMFGDQVRFARALQRHSEAYTSGAARWREWSRTAPAPAVA